ncbi:MAG: NAD(P)H-dependent oxidoreductase [Verrucomicrobia bacterium]|nr:NAD(P)H-dependent oxidoreductase [Verrucomicrobiota bacterium]
MPGILKAWIDQVVSPGHTFETSSEGTKPLHRIRKVVLLVASGGVYKEGDPRDTLSTAIENAFSFIDINDVSLAWADGQNSMYFSDFDQRKAFAIEAAQELAEEVAEIEVPY